MAGFHEATRGGACQAPVESPNCPRAKERRGMVASDRTGQRLSSPSYRRVYSPRCCIASGYLRCPSRHRQTSPLRILLRIIVRVVTRPGTAGTVFVSPISRPSGARLAGRLLWGRPTSVTSSIPLVCALRRVPPYLSCRSLDVFRHVVAARGVGVWPSAFAPLPTRGR